MNKEPTMSETTTAATKSTKKPATKKTADSNGKASGLRAPQVRILKALVKAGKPMTRSQISEKAPVDQAACVEYIGSHNPDVRLANDAKHFPSLVTLGYVKAEMHDVDGRDVVQYTVTAKGAKAAEKA